MTLFGYPIGLLAFFVFSFLAGVYIFLTSIFGGNRDETMPIRVTRGALGFLYMVVTVIAFRQLEIGGSY